MQNLIIKFYNICIIPLDRLENWSDWLSAILFETWFGAAKQLSQVLVGCGVAAPPYCFPVWFWGEGRSEEWCGEGWREGCRGEGWSEGWFVEGWRDWREGWGTPEWGSWYDDSTLASWLRIKACFRVFSRPLLVRIPEKVKI